MSPTALIPFPGPEFARKAVESDAVSVGLEADQGSLVQLEWLGPTTLRRQREDAIVAIGTLHSGAKDDIAQFVPTQNLIGFGMIGQSFRFAAAG